MASKRGNPTIARVGNYAAPVEAVGIDPEMKATLFGTAMNKTEKGYVKSRGGAVSAMEAVRRARRANKQPPVKE